MIQTILTIVSCTIAIGIGILLGIALHNTWNYIDNLNDELRKSREESIKNIERLRKELDNLKNE